MVQAGRELKGGAPAREVVDYAAVAAQGIGAWLVRAEGAGDGVYAAAGGYGGHHPAKCDVELGPMADGFELLSQQVASDRCQIGDSKRLWGTITKAAVAEAGCPRGCLQEGSMLPCAYTWMHVQLRCRGIEVVQARAEWADALSVRVGKYGQTGSTSRCKSLCLR